MYRKTLSLLSLSLTIGGSAHAAGLLGTTVTLDYGPTCCGTLSAVVSEPGVEFAAAGPGLGMVGQTDRLDVDVRDRSFRIDFTEEQDFDLGVGPGAFLTLGNLQPTCPDGSIGTVTGVTSVVTTMEADEWIPSQIAYGFDSVTLIGDSMALGGDDPTRIQAHAGDFIVVEILFSCDPTIDLAGTCPTAVTIAASGFTPGGQVAVVKSDSVGIFSIPNGTCAGTRLDLSRTGIGLVTLASVSPMGEINYAGPIGAGMCTKFLQFVDLSTCLVSNVDQF